MVSQAQEASKLSLEARGDGWFRYDGTTDEWFDAVIRPDGTVVFEVEPSVQIKITSACLVAVCVGQTAKQKKHNRAAWKGVGIGVALLTELLVNGAAGAGNAMGGGNPRAAWGSINQQHAAPPIQPVSKPVPAVPSLVGVSGRFGYLPPPHAAMSAFLQRTMEFRLKLAHEFDGRQIEAQERELIERLFRGWGDPSRSLAERKAEILALWDDLLVVDASASAPAGAAKSQSLDRSRHEAAAEARSRILDFVRRHAPEGTALAFTADELKAINQGRSEADRFQPYSASSTVAQ